MTGGKEDSGHHHNLARTHPNIFAQGLINCGSRELEEAVRDDAIWLTLLEKHHGFFELPGAIGISASVACDHQPKIVCSF